jgi:hypothetical protein
MPKSWVLTPALLVAVGLFMVGTAIHASADIRDRPAYCVGDGYKWVNGKCVKVKVYILEEDRSDGGKRPNRVQAAPPKDQSR